MKATLVAAMAMALMLALGGGAAARSGVAIQNYDNVPIVRADRAVLTAARVRQAIVGALQQGQWIIVDDGAGRLVAGIRHMVQIHDEGVAEVLKGLELTTVEAGEWPAGFFDELKELLEDKSFLSLKPLITVGTARAEQ